MEEIMKIGYILIGVLVLFALNTYASEDSNQSVEELKKVNNNLLVIKERLENLENKQKNRLVVYKDIESIYDYVIGDDYYFEDNISDNVVGIHYRLYWPWDELLYKDNNITEKDKGNINKYKLLAVKERLSINSPDKNTTIDSLYKELNYSDWDRDRIQFAVLTSYVYQAKSPMVAIGVLAYPSYKKYVPGKFDFWRRYALYLGVGTIESLDESKEFKSLAYSTGISVELQKGFGLNFGAVLYSSKDISDPTNKATTERSLTFGVTLSSELWKNLFNLQSKE